MNKTLTLLVLSAALSTFATAGTITGTVSAQGKAVADQGGDGGDYQSPKYKFLEKINYEAMHDFVVYIDAPPLTNTPAPGTLTQVVAMRKVAQHSASFSPHVMPVMAGTTIEWPNQDSIFHNVFSISDAKQFDLGLYKGNPPEKRVTFDQTGRVDVFCSIHANMSCVVLVLPNQFFASTDAHGHYAITNVPPGTYKLKAWHERLPGETREITVPADGEVKADFTLGIKNLPTY
jgi:plastocyanin